jgi:hypothetical protein
MSPALKGQAGTPAFLMGRLRGAIYILKIRFAISIADFLVPSLGSLSLEFCIKNLEVRI